MALWIWNSKENVVTKLGNEIVNSELYPKIMSWQVSKDGTTITTPNSPTYFTGLGYKRAVNYISGENNFIISDNKIINLNSIKSEYANFPTTSGGQNQYVDAGTITCFMYDYDGNPVSTLDGKEERAFAWYGNCSIWVNPSFTDFAALIDEMLLNANKELIRIGEGTPRVGFSFFNAGGSFPSQIVPVFSKGGREVDGKYLNGFQFGTEVDWVQLQDNVSSTSNNWRVANNVDFDNENYGALAQLISLGKIEVPEIVGVSEYESRTGSTISTEPGPYPENMSIYGPGGDTSDPHNPYPSGDSPYTVDPLDSGVETDSPDTDGTWELPFDNVPDSPATVHSVNLGLYNAYALSAAQVMELANYLFSGITEIGENLVKLIWGSKRDVVISLIEFPLMITNQGVEEIRFIFDTELAGMFHGKQLTNEYLPIDFGTIEVPRYSGTFYDFEPYTTLTLYIPYIGYIDLKPTEVIGSTLTISGYVHLTTGEINVNVKSSRTGILGSYSGTIGRMLPIADADATEIYSAIIKTAASLGAVAVAGVGAASASSAAGAASAPSHHAVDVAQAEYQNAIKDWGTATKGIRGKQAEMMNKGVSYEAAVANYNEQRSKYNQVNKAADNAREDFHDALSEAGSNAIGAVTTGFNVTRGTVMTSSNGRLSPQRCFLRIEVPHQNVSRNQKILGYPANSSDSLNSNRLHGYTELRTIELSIPRATLTELQELENILKGGFYLP